MLKKQLLITAFLFISTVAWSAQPSTASMERLMNIQQFDKLISNSLKSTSNNIAVKSILANPQYQQKIQSLPENKRIAVQNKVIEYAQKQFSALNTPKNIAEIHRITIETIGKIFTQEEVDAMIQFYGSKVGQSITAKTPKYIQAVTSGPLLAKLQNDLVRLIEKDAPQMKRDINQIICGKNECQ